MTWAVEVRGLVKSFPLGFLRHQTVLQGIDLTLAPGERAGLIGPNGSGKSTLLRLLAGVESPGAGDLRVLGGAPGDPAIRTRIGFLSEAPPFPPELQAREALALVAGLYLSDRRERRRRVESCLERVGLGPVARRALGRYSRGMLRRFGLAQLFLQEPDLLLLDEPRAGLDSEGSGVLEELLEEARRRGATILVASHHGAMLSAPDDRVVALTDGRIVAQGTVSELVRRTGAVRWCLSGLDDDARRAIEAHVEELGGRVRSRAPDDQALAQLFRGAADA